MKILIPATVVAALTVAAAAPAVAAPTLSFDRDCYLPGQPMEISGSGYTPSGAYC